MKLILILILFQFAVAISRSTILVHSAAMNASDSDNITEDTKCITLQFMFKDYHFDLLILQVFYIITSLLIVVSNALLLTKLICKNVKSRADKLFIILSLSDVCVGLVSIPVLSFPLFIRDLNLVCKLSPLLLFFLFTPFIFSWFMVIVISVDRVLMITKGHNYKKIMTMKVLYGIVAILIVKDVSLSLYMSFNDTFLQETSKFILYSQFICEIVAIGVTVVVYLYLLFFVRSKSKALSKSKHGGHNVNKKLLNTVVCIFICLLIFTLPQFAGMALAEIIEIKNPIIFRNITYWQWILVYSNCYANAFILLYNSKKEIKKTHGFMETKVTSGLSAAKSIQSARSSFDNIAYTKE